MSLRFVVLARFDDAVSRAVFPRQEQAEAWVRQMIADGCTQLEGKCGNSVFAKVDRRRSQQQPDAEAPGGEGEGRA